MRTPWIALALLCAACAQAPQAPAPSSPVTAASAPAPEAVPSPQYDSHSPLMLQVRDMQKEWDNRWGGIPVLQYPNDMMTYQNLVYDEKPDVIVETGTLHGGTTVFLAGLLETMNQHGEIVTIDIDDKYWNETRKKVKIDPRLLKRIHFLKGSSVADETVAQVKKRLEGKKKVLVLLDSAHEKDHVARELELYSQFVPVGGYLVCNDTQLDGHRWLGNGPGPLAASQEFLAKHPEFQVQKDMQKYMISACHDGIMKRIR